MKNTLRVEIDMNYVDGDGIALGSLLMSLGQSMINIVGHNDLREPDLNGKDFLAELRDGNTGEGRVFARTFVSTETLDPSAVITDPTAVVDAGVTVPQDSEAGRNELARANRDRNH